MTKSSDEYFEEVAELIRAADVAYNPSDEIIRTVYVGTGSHPM